MADPKDKVVIEAHALRRATALAVLLHGSRRGPRELKRPFFLLAVSAVVGLVLLVAVFALSRLNLFG